MRCVLDTTVSQRSRSLGISPIIGTSQLRHVSSSEAPLSVLAAIPRVDRSIQSFVRCAFCLNSLVTCAADRRASPAIGLQIGSRCLAGPMTMRSSKATACPHCRKPLPRCSICHDHMGYPDNCEPLSARELAEAHSALLAPRSWAGASSAFRYWTVWCHLCQHGGHAAHVLVWFKHHVECPVSGCSCRCASLDIL